MTQRIGNAPKINPASGVGSFPGASGKPDVKSATKDLIGLLQEGDQNPAKLKQGLTNLLEALKGAEDKKGPEETGDLKDLLKELVNALKSAQQKGPEGAQGGAKGGDAGKKAGGDEQIQKLLEKLLPLLEKMAGKSPDEGAQDPFASDQYENGQSKDFMGQKHCAGCFHAALQGQAA